MLCIGFACLTLLSGVFAEPASVRAPLAPVPMPADPPYKLKFHAEIRDGSAVFKSIRIAPGMPLRIFAESPRGTYRIDLNGNGKPDADEKPFNIYTESSFFSVPILYGKHKINAGFEVEGCTDDAVRLSSKSVVSADFDGTSVYFWDTNNNGKWDDVNTDFCYFGNAWMPFHSRLKLGTVYYAIAFDCESDSMPMVNFTPFRANEVSVSFLPYTAPDSQVSTVYARLSGADAQVEVSSSASVMPVPKGDYSVQEAVIYNAERIGHLARPESDAPVSVCLNADGPVSLVESPALVFDAVAENRLLRVNPPQIVCSNGLAFMAVTTGGTFTTRYAYMPQVYWILPDNSRQHAFTFRPG